MTLVEVVITVWIMGAVMVALCGALFTMVSTAGQQGRRTLAETELRHYADAILAAPYQDCYPTYVASPDPYAQPTAGGFTALGATQAIDTATDSATNPVRLLSISSIKFWYAPSWPAGNPAPTGDAIATADINNDFYTYAAFNTKTTTTDFTTGQCDTAGGGPGVDDGLQYITVQAKDTSTNVTYTASILKRKASLSN